MNYTTQTLGELLASQNETIRRNTMSILKTLQKNMFVCLNCGTMLTTKRCTNCEQIRNKNL